MRQGLRLKQDSRDRWTQAKRRPKPSPLLRSTPKVQDRHCQRRAFTLPPEPNQPPGSSGRRRLATHVALVQIKSHSWTEN